MRAGLAPPGLVEPVTWSAAFTPLQFAHAESCRQTQDLWIANVEAA